MVRGPLLFRLHRGVKVKGIVIIDLGAVCRDMFVKFGWLQTMVEKTLYDNIS